MELAVALYSRLASMYEGSVNSTILLLASCQTSRVESPVKSPATALPRLVVDAPDGQTMPHLVMSGLSIGWSSGPAWRTLAVAADPTSEHKKRKRREFRFMVRVGVV